MSQTFTILVADDDADIRDVMAIVLESYGFCAVVVASGSEALSALQAHPDVGLIVLDLMMPGLSGADTMTMLKSDATLSQIPVIILSGDNAAHSIAASIGATMCLSKPVDLNRLLSAINQFANSDRRGAAPA